MKAALLLSPALLACAFAAGAHAQEAPATPAANENPRADQNPPANETPWFTLAPKLGYVSFGESEFEVDSPAGKVKTKMKSRGGPRLAVDLALGGDGIAWEIAPALAFESADGTDFTALGLYTGLVYRFALGGPLTPCVGIGLAGAMLSSDDVDLGAELGGRIPVGLTYRLTPTLGIVGELAFTYGATGIKPKKSALVDDPKLEFGKGTAFDLSVGVRWP